MPSSDIILVYDTALGNSAALKIGDALLLPGTGKDIFIRKSAILIQIDGLLEKNNVRIGDITAIGLNIGPGSFTGIRVGMALAKGLARPANLRVAAVTSFQAISHLINESGDYSIVIDAGGGFFYKADVGEENEAVNNPACKLILREEFRNGLGGIKKIILYGDNLREVSDYIRKNNKSINIVESSDSLLPSIAEITSKAIKDNKTINYKELKPYYIKPSYVEL